MDKKGLATKRLSDKLDNFLSGTLRADADAKEKKRHDAQLDKLSRYSRKFVESNALYVLQKTAPKGTSKTYIESVAVWLASCDPVTSAEFVGALEYTGDFATLTSQSFRDNLLKMNSEMQNAVLAQMRWTGNTTSLSDPRLYEPDMISFLEYLGKESGSEWLRGVALTGNIAALTDIRNFDGAVRDLMRDNPDLASNFSYALGVAPEPDKMHEKPFLNALSKLDNASVDLITASWVTGKFGELATEQAANQALNIGASTIWRDLARNKNRDIIIFQRLDGGGHSMGAFRQMQTMLGTGYDVIYLPPEIKPEAVAELAGAEKASGIVFSITEKGSVSKVHAVSAALAAKNEGVPMFAGGNVSAARVSNLKGVTLLSGKHAIQDMQRMISFSRTAPQIPQPSSGKAMRQSPSGARAGRRGGTDKEPVPVHQEPFQKHKNNPTPGQVVALEFKTDAPVWKDIVRARSHEGNRNGTYGMAHFRSILPESTTVFRGRTRSHAEKLLSPEENANWQLHNAFILLRTHDSKTLVQAYRLAEELVAARSTRFNLQATVFRQRQMHRHMINSTAFNPIIGAGPLLSGKSIPGRMRETSYAGINAISSEALNQNYLIAHAHHPVIELATNKIDVLASIVFASSTRSFLPNVPNTDGIQYFGTAEQLKNIMTDTIANNRSYMLRSQDFRYDSMPLGSGAALIVNLSAFSAFIGYEGNWRPKESLMLRLSQIIKGKLSQFFGTLHQIFMQHPFRTMMLSD